jgi:hypothetical protein
LTFAFLESLSVSGPKPDYLSSKAIPVILAYFVSYLFVTLISRRYNQLLNIVSLVSISIAGSLLAICYNSADLILRAWNNQLEDKERVFFPELFGLFIFISIVFFIMAVLQSGIIWISAKGLIKRKIK